MQGSLLGLVLLSELEKRMSNDTAKFSDDIKFFSSLSQVQQRPDRT